MLAMKKFSLQWSCFLLVEAKLKKLKTHARKFGPDSPLFIEIIENDL